MYVPNTSDEQRQMLERIGLGSVDALFDAIPEPLRCQSALRIPPALTELELTDHLSSLASENGSCDRLTSFLGGGCYDHFVPAVVDAIASRSEYYTAYTPYQAEASQGTLQVGFEFQTLMCQLTGLEASNSSLYEGATAVVEAVLMAIASTGRPDRVVVCETLHPEYRHCLATYLANLATQVVTVPPGPDGRMDPQAVAQAVDDRTAALVVASPNFFGQVEAVGPLAEIARRHGALAIQAFDPVSLGMLRRPGEHGIDIAVGEGQGLGIAMSYGGPFLGILACRERYVRKMPGRLVGQTVDGQGRRAFVLTLQTREQHIRREKATSNICTNQGLLALRAAVHLALLGPQGLREVAQLCWHKAHYAASQLSGVPGIRLRFPDRFVKEFVVELPGPAAEYLAPLREAGFHAGVPLGGWWPSMDRCLLVAVTEKRTKRQIDEYVAAWRRVLA